MNRQQTSYYLMAARIWFLMKMQRYDGRRTEERVEAPKLIREMCADTQDCFFFFFDGAGVGILREAQSHRANMMEIKSKGKIEKHLDGLEAGCKRQEENLVILWDAQQ